MMAPRLLLFLLVILLFGCKNRSTGPEVTSKAEADSVLQVFLITTDSVRLAWDRMIKDDDEKLFHIKRLLDEVSYTGNYNAGQLDSLRDKQAALVALRYDQKTMADSDLIDEYDVRTSELIREVTTYAKSHPDFAKYPLMEELIMDIMEADNRVLLHRIKYDNFCREYNSLIELQGAVLAPAAEEGLEKMPLFTLYE